MNDKICPICNTEHRTVNGVDTADHVMRNSVAPRYSFGDVQGTLTNGLAVQLGLHVDWCTVEFDYTDRLDGVLYHVSASGWRTKKEEVTK